MTDRSRPEAAIAAPPPKQPLVMQKALPIPGIGGILHAPMDPKNILHYVVLPAVLGGFAVAYLFSNGDLAFSVRISFGLLALLAGPFAFYRLRFDRKASGLSEAEYLLKEADGAANLLGHAVTARAIGWFCIALPIILMSIVGIATKSLSLALIPLSVVTPFCLTGAYACFRYSTKARRIAEDAGAKIW